MAISNKIYKKIILKKYGLRIILPVLLFLFLLIISAIELTSHFIYKKIWLLNFDWSNTQIEELDKGILSITLENLKDSFPWI